MINLKRKERYEPTITQVIHPSPEPAGMTSFLAVSLPPDSCPEKTGEFLSVPIGSRKVRLETDWKITGIVRKHPTGIRRQRTSQKRLGNGRKRRKPAGSDTEIAGTGRLFEVPATGLIDLGRSNSTTREDLQNHTQKKTSRDQRFIKNENLTSGIRK